MRLHVTLGHVGRADEGPRYEISNPDDVTWQSAEKQVKSAVTNGAPGKATTVSVPKLAKTEEDDGVREKRKKGKEGKEGEKKRKVSALEDARRELDKVENSESGKKKKKKSHK